MDQRKIKEIGRKARESLKEERSKRKEIVRIHEKEPAISNKSRSTSKFAKSVKQTQKKRKATKTNRTSLTSLKRKRATSPLTASELNQAENVDEWMPSTQHMFNHLGQEEEMQYSNIVRIYGFPTCANEKHLKKFFSGLSLEQIFTIPAFEKSIQNFDLEDTARGSPLSTKRSPKIKAARRFSVDRHRPSVRIFCKFKSTSAAQAAIQRSGEILFFDNDYGKVHAGAAIAIVPISQSIAVHLSRNMALVWRKGQDLDTVMELAEKEIPIHVRQILWVMLAQKLKTDLDMTIYVEENDTDDENDSDHEGFSCQQLLEYGPHWKPRDLAILHNKLLDLYESLKKCYPLHMRQFDPSIPLLPSNYLRCFYAVSHWLLREMGVIENCLFQSKSVVV
jgi:hypothetical protein